MDTNVKAMIKLIEEDADSFARRAEMYYKKRPELLKLVEEFYRAYRALAERYNHATGALRQAQRTMAEAFPNQMPLVSVDDSPSASSGSEVGPHTPEMPSPMRAFYDPDSLHKDTSGVSSNLHTISRNGAYSEENDALYNRKGLKQLNEMFAAGEGTARAKFLEGKVRKGLTFEEEDGKSFEGKIHNGPTEEEDFKDEMKRLKEDISRLLTDNQNLKNHCTSESENAENLKDALSKLESEKEAASLQHQLSQERISNLETEISSMKDKIEKLNNEMAAGNLKLNCSEEQCLVLEKVNQSLQLELEKSVQKIKVQQQELEQSKKELESLQNSMQEQQLKANLLCLEIQTGVEKLKGMELSKVGLEEESCKLKEMNGFLKEENLSCALKLNVLQDEMISLKETKVRLEDEVELHVVENEGLKQELYSVKDERRHLEQKHKGLVQRMEAVSLNVESLESSIKELQNEKMLLLENLKNMEIVSEKNAALEISLSDTNYELEGLREKANMLEESRKTLHDKIAVSVTEKAMLVAQLDIVSQNMGMLLEKNTLLENSLSDVNTELEHLREGMKCLENSCQSLNDQISNLLAEKHTLLSQVESFKLSVENMEGNYLEAEEKNLNLKREKDSMVHQIMELEHSLRLEKKEHEVLLQASKSQLASLEIELHLLQEKSQDREEKLEVEQQKCMGGMLENFILKRCLCDMEEKNLIISKECSKLLEASRSAEKLISELEHKDLVQKKKIMLLLDHYEKPREGVLALSKALNIVEYGRNGNGIKDEMLLQIVLGEVRNLQDSKLDVQDENLRLDLEIVVLGTLIQQTGLEKLHLYRELDNRTSDVLVLQTTKHELIEMNEQLRQDVKASYERENIRKAQMRILRQQLSDSYEVHQKSQIEVSRLLEENHSLYDQNLNLLAEKNNLISQVEYIREAVESLESTCEVLEYKHLSLQIERDSMIHQMLELEGFLRRGRLEHDALLLSNKSQVVILENQIQILQENLVVKDEEFEVKQQETMNALLEIFILQRCLFDMKDKSSVLSRESQKHLEASRSAEIIISQLEQRDTIQNRKITLLSNNNNKLKEGIFLLLKELSINMECQTSDGITDEILLQTILGEIKNLSKSKSDAQDGCEHLRLEMSIFVSLLKQIGVEKNFHYVELQGLSKELIILQSEKHEMMEMVKQLQQNLHISNQREQVLEAEIEKLCGKFSNLCAAHQTSQAEVSKLLEENGLLSKKFCNLRKSKEALEEENSEVLAEAMLLDHLYLLFRSICAERAVDLKVLTDNLGCVSAVKDDLNEEIRVQNEKMRILKEENNHLKESVTNLEECRSCLLVLEFELNLARKFCDELNFQMEREKDLFIQKEMELSVAQNKNMELCRELECIKKDMDGAKVVREELENKILILSEENASSNKEISHIREANKLLHEDLGRLNGEVEVLKRRGEHLSFELQKETVAIGQCEGEAITLLNDIQTSTVIAAVLEEKLLEQIVAYESLMMSSILHREIWAEEIAVSNACACELKKKLGELEGENRSLHADLVACFPLVMSLRDSIASLEEHTLLFSSLQERQDECLISHQTEQIKEDRDTAKAGFSELQRLISKVEVLQKVITNTASLFMQERLDSSANLEAARKEIEELKLKQSSGHRNSKEKYGQAMKDIQLDKVSSSLAHRPRRVETSELDDQMLELWETAERDDIEEVIEEEKSEHPSSELVSEREPSVDKLEISTKANESPREWKRSVIERISSDTRRLSILQTSMKQLKTKMANSEKKKHPKGLEYDTVKVQLREAEQAIFEQTNINGTLKQKVREKFESSNGATEERRQISEQARRGSEKIGKLELELQKIEYILLKIEEETENKRARVGDRTSVLLREYLHGRRDGRGRRKGRFCGCVRPKTEG